MAATVLDVKVEAAALAALPVFNGINIFPIENQHSSIGNDDSSIYNAPSRRGVAGQQLVAAQAAARHTLRKLVQNYGSTKKAVLPWVQAAAGGVWLSAAAAAPQHAQLALAARQVVLLELWPRHRS